MDKSFTEQEAKKVIEYNKSFNSRVEGYFSSQNFYRNSISFKTSEIFSKGIFEQFCEDEIAFGKSMLSSQNDLLELIRLIYGYRTIEAYIEELKQYYNFKIGFINNALQDLSVSADKMKWFFATNDSKYWAIQAYNYFNSPTHFQFFDDINRQLKIIDDLKNVDLSLAKEDYYKNSQEYGRIVCECNPNVYYNPKDIRILKDVFFVHEQIYSDSSRIISEQKYLIEDVINNANKYIDYKTMETLYNTSIESIKKPGDGLKVKLLIDNGINNVADLLEKCYLIEAIQGIGELTAPKYQEIAIEYYNDCKNNIRIRFNYDNKDEVSNSLLVSLHKYIRKTEIAQQLYELWIENEADVRNSILTLEQITNGIQWLFYTPDQKLSVNKAFVRLKELIESDYYNSSKKLIDYAAKIDFMNLDEVWNDYLNDTVLYISTLEQLCEDELGYISRVGGDDSYGLNPNLADEVDGQNYSLEGLSCSLRRYQTWGLKFILHQKRVLLGDEMGLGKTVQAIAALVSLRNSGANHFVVVCPASVLQNWYIEVNEKSDLRAYQIYGNKREKTLSEWIQDGGVAITTYESLKSISMPEDLNIDMVVVDEAHYVKNPKAQRSISIMSLVTRTSRVLFMTGTALENKVDEMINLVDMLNSNVAEELRLTMHSPFSFKNIVMPVYYRRRRDDVLQELPDLIEINEWCQMTDADVSSYSQNVLEKNFMQARRVSWNVDDLNNSSKARRVMEIVNEVEEAERKVIIFSYFLETIQCLKELLGEKCLDPIDGSVSPIRRQEIVQEFNASPNGTVLLAQIQTGGTGLNIQAASVVIICEPQLKPSVESQAISRAYRMGQNRNVFVYRILCKDSIDERIIEILGNKQDLFNEYADESFSADDDAYLMQNEEQQEINEVNFNDMMQKEYERFCSLNASNLEVITNGQ